MSLASRIWVDAYRARLDQQGIFAHVAARGDAVAGAVLVKCATMDGRATCHQRSFDLTSGERAWIVLAEGDEASVDAAIARQRSFDPDLWVIEVEDPRGRHLLDDPTLAP
ncbi:MAG: DUF1491 family protein [Paracoccaceae bacterium]